MFSNLYFGEIRKLLRPKTLIILAIIIILFLTIFAISYEKLIEFNESMGVELEFSADDDLPEPSMHALFNTTTVNISAEEIDLAISYSKRALEETERSAKDNPWYLRGSFDMVYSQRAQLRALEYIKKHKLYNQDIELYSDLATTKSAEGFTKSMFSILLSIMVFYGIVIGSGSFAQEIKTGTLKMLFLRPVSPNKVTTAKLLALLTMTTVLLLGTTLLAYIYGLIRFGSAAAVKVLVVFNASGAFMSTKSAMLFASMMFGVLQTLSFAVFAFALGTLSKNRVLATIIGIVLTTGFTSLILSLLKLGRFLFTTSMALGSYFGISSAVPAGGNFFIALPVYVAYMTLFIVSTYVVVNKRDLA